MRIKTAGLTLVELVVAMGLFGVIMVTLFPAFILSNLIDNTSKEFNDANNLAQQQIEEVYQLAQTMTLESAIDALEGTYAYVCTPDASPSELVFTCVKDSGNFHTNLSLTRNQPRLNVTDAVVTVSTLQGEVSGNRSSIQLYMRFDLP